VAGDLTGWVGADATTNSGHPERSEG